MIAMTKSFMYMEEKKKKKQANREPLFGHTKNEIMVETVTPKRHQTGHLPVQDKHFLTLPAIRNNNLFREKSLHYAIKNVGQKFTTELETLQSTTIE
jgi:hypothetical protein